MNTFDFFGIDESGQGFQGSLKTKASRPARIDQEIEAKFNIKIINCSQFNVFERGKRGIKRAWSAECNLKET